MADNTKWVCIFKTSNRFEAEAVKGNIESAGINCVILNRQDSSLLAFGYVEVHVPEHSSNAAQLVINNQFEQN
ncbi:MAG: DUF2007 domain-containing protein [Chitinophagaceae bacterium]|nr:DUF2007 domain-containing protein [Chitinophagaceae bacterium]